MNKSVQKSLAKIGMAFIVVLLVVFVFAQDVKSFSFEETYAKGFQAGFEAALTSSISINTAPNLVDNDILIDLGPMELVMGAYVETMPPYVPIPPNIPQGICSVNDPIAGPRHLEELQVFPLCECCEPLNIKSEELKEAPAEVLPTTLPTGFEFQKAFRDTLPGFTVTHAVFVNPEDGRHFSVSLTDLREKTNANLDELKDREILNIEDSNNNQVFGAYSNPMIVDTVDINDIKVTITVERVMGDTRSTAYFEKDSKEYNLEGLLTRSNILKVVEALLN